MAQGTWGGVAQDTSLFVRKATGLVRSWSVFDAFIYATFSINLVTLGLYSLSLSYGFKGNLITAVVVGAVFTIFEVIVYANLIAVMPRAGGDYIWQSRILGGAIGFILAVTGWWFILWLWVPLYGQMLVYEFFTPVLAILGLQGAALWFTGTPAGLLTGSLVCIAFVTFYISLGMKWYARIQKFCFWGGMTGLALAFLLLLFGNNQTFVNNLNSIVPAMFGTAPGDVYQATLEAGKDAAQAAPLRDLAFGASFAIIPMIAFFNLWPNWGATLYGEVRGATDYKRNFWGMALAVIVTTVLVVIFLALIGKTLGWDFYNRANGAFWSYLYAVTDKAPPLPFWPYPGLLAAFLSTSPVVQLLVVVLMSLWWFGWSATVFMSSTRVIFAAAFDRLLPERVADVTPRTRTPVTALLMMTIPSIIIAILYAYNLFGFQKLALDATLVIALTFFGTTVAAVILPWHKRELFQSSPVTKLMVSSLWSKIITAAYAVAAAWLILLSVAHGLAATQAGTQGALALIILIGIWLVTAALAAVLLWILYYVGRRVVQGESLPLVTAAGLVFLAFLDWLLVEWIWDPNLMYGIGWSNHTSIVFMVIMYALAAAIYFGFKAYRKRQAIDIDKIYEEIPVE